MDNFLKWFLILILFIIISLIAYYFLSEVKNNKTYQKHNKIKKWQKERLISLLQKRIKVISSTGKSINQDEKKVLSTIVNNMGDIKSWNDLERIANDNRTISFVNVAIMDNLYVSEINSASSKNEFIQNLFLLDCINGGIKFEGEKPICFPVNFDMKETIKLIVNNQEELNSVQTDILSSFIASAWEQRSPESFNEFKREYIENKHKTLISDSAIDKTLAELINKKYVKDLSNPAKFVISKIIIEILSNIIYSGNDYKKLTENAKIYIRILASVVANESYEKVYETFSK